MTRSKLTPITLMLSLTLALVLATAAFAHFKTVKTLPEADAVVEKPVRTLRIWFSQEPDVPLSKLELEGPNGPMTVTGMHSMGEKDLMARVAGAMPDGLYTAKWSAAGDDGHVLEGSWSFTIQRGGN